MRECSRNNAPLKLRGIVEESACHHGVTHDLAGPGWGVITASRAETLEQRTSGGKRSSSLAAAGGPIEVLFSAVFAESILTSN